MALLISMLVGYLLPIIILGVPSFSRSFDHSLSTQQRAQIVKIGLAGIVTAPMFWILSSSDRWFLGYFQDSASVGIYSIGYNIAIIGTIVNNAVHASWLPEASRLYEQDAALASQELGLLLERILMILAIVWLAIVASGGDVVRLLAGPAFHSAAQVVPLLAAATFFNGAMHLANAGLLLKKKLHLAIYWWVASAIICLGLNWYLVPMHGRIGAAITQVVTFAFVTLGIYITSQHFFPLKLRVFRLIILMAIIVSLGLVMFPAWSVSPIVSLLLKFPIGISIALLIFYFEAPDLFKVYVMDNKFIRRRL